MARTSYDPPGETPAGRRARGPRSVTAAGPETQSRRAPRDLGGSALWEELLVEEREGVEGRVLGVLLRVEEERLLDELREGGFAVELRGEGEGRVAELDPVGGRGVTTRPRLDEPLRDRESASGTILAPPMLSITLRGIGAVLVSRPRFELVSFPVSFS